MKTIDVRLVKDNGKQKFYELSSPIRYGKDVFGLVDLNESLEEEYKQVNEKYKSVFSRECRLLCVSDAMFHDERIVFVGQCLNGEYTRCKTTVCGSMTMLTTGGDTSKMYDIEVYLRFLGIINKVKFNLK